MVQCEVPRTQEAGLPEQRQSLGSARVGSICESSLCAGLSWSCLWQLAFGGLIGLDQPWLGSISGRPGLMVMGPWPGLKPFLMGEPWTKVSLKEWRIFQGKGLNGKGIQADWGPCPWRMEKQCCTVAEQLLMLLTSCHSLSVPHFPYW